MNSHNPQYVYFCIIILYVTTYLFLALFLSVMEVSFEIKKPKNAETCGANYTLEGLVIPTVHARTRQRSVI